MSENFKIFPNFVEVGKSLSKSGKIWSKITNFGLGKPILPRGVASGTWFKHIDVSRKIPKNVEKSRFWPRETHTNKGGTIGKPILTDGFASRGQLLQISGISEISKF